MAVLVTGGMGAIGSFVTRRLVEIGVEPVVYARHKDTTLLSDMEQKVIFVEGDILDLEKLVQAIKTYAVDRVIHASAIVPGALTPAMAIRVNAEGTATVLEAALRCNIKRVVYTSAKGVYNEATGSHGHPVYEPINEDWPADANMGWYGLTKLFGERVGFQYHQEHGIDFIALRFSSTYGPGKLLKHGATSPMSVHGRMIEHAMLGKPFRHPQGTAQKDDFIYNKDTAHGIVLACFADNVKHRIFNIGSGVGATLVDLANAVRKIYPDADIQIGPGLDFFNIGNNVYSVYDVTRAKEELGFVPQYTLDDGVRDYVEMMRRLKIEPVYTPSS
jgi:UDP-glucose 4-epimerase